MKCRVRVCVQMKVRCMDDEVYIAPFTPATDEDNCIVVKMFGE